MDLAALDEGRVSRRDRESLAVFSSDPAIPGHHDEELAKARFVRADCTPGLEVQDIRMGLALAFGELDRGREPYLERPFANPLGKA